MMQSSTPVPGTGKVETTDAVTTMSTTKQPSVLPNEIWWLVTKLMKDQHDFHGLFTFARVNRTMASLALPQLYLIHDVSPAFNAHIFGIGESMCLWRSIIASSLGRTLFPYCCWVDSFKLGNLHSHLEDLSRNNPIFRAKFFKPPLDRFEIRTGKRTRGAALNLDAIAIEVANTIINFIRATAEQDDKRVTLRSLEAFHFPTANIANWVSGLSSLMSLNVRDGSVLTSQVAQAIRESCPAMRYIHCYSCQGADVDKSMAEFLEGLAPNTLSV